MTWAPDLNTVEMVLKESNQRVKGEEITRFTKFI